MNSLTFHPLGIILDFKMADFDVGKPPALLWILFASPESQICWLSINLRHEKPEVAYVSLELAQFRMAIANQLYPHWSWMGLLGQRCIL